MRALAPDRLALTEKIEIGSPTGKLIFHVFGALAEFGRNLIPPEDLAASKSVLQNTFPDMPILRQRNEKSDGF